jgi:hypothetical protein
MTVEAYLQTKLPKNVFDSDDIEAALLSVLRASPTAFEVLDAEDDVKEVLQDEEKANSLDYALSTLYYAVSGVFSGGSITEQRSDIKLSISGFTITQADRDYFRGLADKIREDLGCTVEEDPASDDGMFDATYLTQLQ